MFVRFPRTIVAICSAYSLVLSVGCGAGSAGGGGGGGGVATIGQVAGTTCKPDLHSNGCFGKNLVTCDATSKKWTDSGIVCSATENCKETQDPDFPSSGTKKLAECVAIPVGNTPTDTVSSGDVALSDASSADTLGPDVKGADTKDAGSSSDVPVAGVKACLTEKCATEYSACSAKPVCKSAVECILACGADSACAAGCVEGISNPALDAIAACAKANGCGTSENKCGNGACDPGENSGNCPKDCPVPVGKCGNGTCDDGEADTCLIDCDPLFKTAMDCPKTKCVASLGGCLNEAKCLAVVNCIGSCACTKSCQEQCMGSLGDSPAGAELSLCMVSAKCSPSCSSCGDGVCDAPGETPKSCGKDCPAVCGDGSCDLPETKAKCPDDCGAVVIKKGCGAVPGSGGCGGCACEKCVCTGPNPGGDPAGDSYCCDSAWDDNCGKECAACPNSGCGL